MAQPEVGDEVQFPTNSDTIADDVDGRFGIVIRTTNRYLVVSVDGYTIAVKPDEVEVQ